MRILFAISACVWAYLVGRCIAFGAHSKGVYWQARVVAETWYRLTPLCLPIPYTLLFYLPLLFTALKAYSLALDNDTIHILGVLLLTSTQAFFPIFIIQLHRRGLIAIWALVNVVGNIGYATLHTPLLALPILLAALFHAWFLALELQLYWVPIERHSRPYTNRQPRAMARVMTV
jgi:hypothetical protein